MVNEYYYKLPMNFEHFFESGRFDKCNELASIDQQIELLLTTCPGEHRFDTQYGCEIWDIDFVSIYSLNNWMELFKKCVVDSIDKYEKRIKNVIVDVVVIDTETEEDVRRSKNIRKRIDIYVSGVLASTDDSVSFRYSLFLSPLSSE